MYNIRHYVSVAIDHAGSLFSYGTAHLAWGLGVVVVLLSVTAYALWRYSPVAASVTVSDQSSHSTTLHTQQPAPAKIDTRLNADTSTSGAPSEDASRSQAANDNQVNAQLHINGQAVPVPSQGTVHKEISNQNGTTSVDVSVNSATSGTSQSDSHTSMNINVNSSTKSESTDAGQTF